MPGAPVSGLVEGLRVVRPPDREEPVVAQGEPDQKKEEQDVFRETIAAGHDEVVLQVTLSLALVQKHVVASPLLLP